MIIINLKKILSFYRRNLAETTLTKRSKLRSPVVTQVDTAYFQVRCARRTNDASVIFLPEVRNVDVSIGNITQTQIMGQSTK